MVLQYNKRDLPGVVPVDELDDALNFRAVPAFAASAVVGEGVFSTLKSVSQLVLQSLSRRFGQAGQPSERTP
jgi:signal recognition particle receptor subunit beta